MNAGLAKADLQSRLVNEFPELQGIAGRHYALADAGLADLSDGDRAVLAAALDEAYMPRFAGDAIAPSPLGRVLAIAERLDTLAGGFAAGLKPTGNKDPFALRRAALGLARTLIESETELALPANLDQAVDLVQSSMPGCSLSVGASAGAVSRSRDAGDIYDFVVDRLRGYYEQRGDYDAAGFDAVADVRPASLVDFDQRLRALRAFAGSDDGQALAAANKRCGNLLRKAREGGEPVPDTVDPALFEGAPEADLATALAAAEAQAAPLFDQRRYGEALARLAALRPAVDAFFDQVMVMADDPAVRGNRLALLARLQARFLRIADISRLAGG
jgi:glycyl-tRNA synthetase beta chain